MTLRNEVVCLFLMPSILTQAEIDKLLDSLPVPVGIGNSLASRRDIRKHSFDTEGRRESVKSHLIKDIDVDRYFEEVLMRRGKER